MAMTIPKPKHLKPVYAEQFNDQSVADAYVNYQPYSTEVFEVLESLIQGSPCYVLDIGCGTGELARPLARIADRVDAVDQSAAMIEIGRTRDGGDRPNIRWICQGAEDFPYLTQYSLIVAGASLHWMDWHKVLPRMSRALSRHGYLAIVGGHVISAPWVDDLGTILPRYSTNKDFGSFNVITELERRSLFSAVDRRRTRPRQHRLSVDGYVELLHAAQRILKTAHGPRRGG